MMNRRKQGSNNGDSALVGGSSESLSSPSRRQQQQRMSSTTKRRPSTVLSTTMMVVLFVILCVLFSDDRSTSADSSSSSIGASIANTETKNALRNTRGATALDGRRKATEEAGTGVSSTSTIETEKGGVVHYEFDSKEAVGSGSKEPVVIRGWISGDNKPQSWHEDGFVSKYGRHIQYLKDGTVQPFQKKKNGSEEGQSCRLPGSEIVKLMKKRTNTDILLFTNNKENESFMKELAEDYQVPSYLSHVNDDGSGFQVFSAMTKGKSHSFHKHGEAWIGQVEGRKMWWFLPPTTSTKPERVNACDYLNGSQPPKGALSCVQEPGDIIWFPKDWYHATCALDDWTIAVGAQQGPLIRQQFKTLDQSPSSSSTSMTKEQIQREINECLDSSNEVAVSSPASKAIASGKNSNNKKDAEGWTWFDGNLNEYYNSLEKDHKRDPNKIGDYAVHRWLGPKRSTEIHYELLHTAAATYHSDTELNVLDGGCGLGSALMWMEQKNPQWELTGHTISEEQYKFVTEKLPPHKFKVNLRSYDEIDDPGNNGKKKMYDFVYSIEALIHTPDLSKTLKEWSEHLTDGGVIAIIDDFLSAGTSKDDEEVVAFSKSWLANILVTPTEMGKVARKFGLEVVENRDLDAEYRINELNYRNKMPDIKPDRGRSHQGWMGSKWRQRLMLEGKLTYNLLVLQKGGRATIASSSSNIPNDSKTCSTVPSKKSEDDPSAQFNEITPELMTGKGKGGGDKMACISSWYCCNKGTEWYENLDANRTDNTAFLKLSKDLFGHYVDSFAKHLNEHYKTYPAGAEGRFLDIGGTGSTASGMAQVTSKFQHFAGPLEYWILDSDPGAKELQRTLYCDIDDCPKAESCGFDVTFSHTVLEHAQRPWKSFDTVARLTKKGGLTMHLVPFSYQYHATPDDNYRFSHKALTTLLEDRGFTVLEVGYDICTKPNNMLRRIDEHYDVIWLTYIIGRKN